MAHQINTTSFVYIPEIYNQYIDECMTLAIENTFGRNQYFKGLKLTKLHSGTQTQIDFNSTHVRAWLMEYGSGIYLDESNPYLDDYYSTSVYYDERRSHNNKILGRGDSYEQVDYVGGSGEVRTLQGYKEEGYVFSDRQQKFLSTKPKPFLQDLLEECYKEFERIFNERQNVLYDRLSKVFKVE